MMLLSFFPYFFYLQKMKRSDIKMQVNSIEELKQVLSQKIAKVIMEDHELKEAVNQGSKQIYDEFEPMTYQRRYENGGFGDPDNIDMEVEVTGNGVEVKITNDTLAVGYNDGEYLDYYIDKGIYQTKNKPPERHFMEYSKNIIEENDLIKKVIKKGLQGVVDVK